MEDMLVIGVSGYARSGKDSVAQVLAESHGFTRMGIADEMKEALLDVNPTIVCTGLDRGRRTGPWKLATIVALEGWEGAKDYAEVRELLQRFGTSIKSAFGRRCWLKLVLKKARKDGVQRLVIPDVRLPFETQAVDYVIRVTRPGVGPANEHETENSLTNEDGVWDYLVVNSTTLEELSDCVNAIMAEFGLDES